MAKKKRKKSQLQIEYEKERRRIQKFIRRNEQRGFRFEPDILPNIPKRITQASIRRLRRITPKSLYEKSTALSESGKIVSGTERAKELRSISAQKSAETRKRKLEKERLKQSFEEQRKKLDAQQLDRLKRDAEYRQRFTEGNLIYEQILDAINDINKTHKQAGEHLKSILDSEIAKYGKETVMRSIAQAPQEMLELCEIALHYNPGDARHDSAIREILILITGAIPDAQESRDLQDAIDSDEYEDFY